MFDFAVSIFPAFSRSAFMLARDVASEACSLCRVGVAKRYAKSTASIQ